ncbi:hypothetical protein BT96DRAFT_1009481 [Gymnopus androsaceus JB14]|uniref:Uncharacterized protein n=1 Tax=Gymnopus androsaceus JB14 TaxID=1447944 RepID=A0A6A4GCK9_9AGAR|nr:hypothetical protein BT96DRAFT_1009481 [Gymnopus androsaceus JB14]
MAQQINAKQKVESSIESGFEWYWGKLVLNTVSFNIPLLRCLTRIRDDILSVWNLNDPEESLKGVDFNTEMFKLIKPLLQKSGSPPRDTLEKSNGVADLAGKISPGLEKALAYAGLLGVVANVLLDRIEESPVTALCLGAYVVDLTWILYHLFLTTLNHDPPRPVSKALVSFTFQNYQQNCAEAVHDRVREIAYKETLHPVKEIEALVKMELGLEA